ncbi:MAG: pilus assembly protein, partial [Acidimicrobiia bacterium]|nr:pilus assembly protein [Acidimicrobiia bacterium]
MPREDLSRRRHERGASLAEAALATPVFLVLIFAVIEFGQLAHDSLATTNATREGAREALPDRDFAVASTPS